MRLVVIGGGISGLAAAWKATCEAHRRALDLEVTVLESAPTVGGKARSVQTSLNGRAESLLIEAGPQGFVNDEPVMDELIEAAGLQEEVLLPREAAKHRFLYHGARLREISPHPVRFAKSGVLGPLGLLRLATEPLRARGDPAREETLLEFGARRIGQRAAERLLGPAALGVFGGDAGELCASSAFPRLTSMEQEHGSLFRGLLQARKQARQNPGRRGLVALRRGLQSLAQGLASEGSFDVRCSSPVEAIEAIEPIERRPTSESTYRVRTESDHIAADAVIVATDLRASQRLLHRVSTEAAQALAEIPCADLLVVALAYARGATRQAPSGYGVLIPRSERIRMLGCQWESDSFEGRSPDDVALFRCMYGGAVDPDAMSLDDARVFELAERELARILPLREPAISRHLFRWQDGIPQYTLGHAARVERVESELAKHPGLFLAGNSLHGVGFSKAAAIGAERGRQAVDWLVS